MVQETSEQAGLQFYDSSQSPSALYERVVLACIQSELQFLRLGFLKAIYKLL
jgi:hypothetical protein